MEKARASSKGKIHVTGARAIDYEIYPPDSDEAAGGREVRPATEKTAPYGIVDTKRAIAGLLACDTDFRFWLAARDSAWFLANMREQYGARMMREIRGLAMQNTRRRRRFDKRLRKWVNEFGALNLSGKGDTDCVDDIMRAAHGLRAWALRDLSPPDRVWSSGTFMLKVDNYAPEVNKAAGLCTRDPETAVWVAPTLWSALCHSIQHASDYGWTFAECEADDCFNVFLKKRTEHVTCSQRCGKRKRDHEKRDQQRQ